MTSRNLDDCCGACCASTLFGACMPFLRFARIFHRLGWHRRNPGNDSRLGPVVAAKFHISMVFFSFYGIFALSFVSPLSGSFDAMPVPAIEMNFPSGSTVAAKPDKLRYMLQQRRELARITKEKITPRLVSSLVSMDSQRYFFIDWRRFKRRKTADGEANTLIRDFHQVFGPLDRPRNDYIRYCDDYMVMDAFSIAKLNECFASPALKGTDSEYILEALGLRDGLPDNCVAPSLRMFDRRTFMSAVVGANRHDLTEAAFRAHLRAPSQVKIPLTKALFEGAHDTKPEFTITTATARAIFDTVNLIVPNALPDVDVAFPCAPAKWLSWKREPHLRPLDPRDGNLV
jgi:hypothetical protein